MGVLDKALYILGRGLASLKDKAELVTSEMAFISQELNVRYLQVVYDN